MNIKFTKECRSQDLHGVITSRKEQNPFQEPIFDRVIDGKYTLFASMEGISSFREREKLGALFGRKLEGKKGSSLSLDAREHEEAALDFLTGLLLSSWRFTKYKTGPSKEHIFVQEVIVICSDPVLMERNFKERAALVEGIKWARSLGSEPANVLYPEAFAKEIRSLEALGVKIEIFDAQVLEEKEFNGILAVGKGSTRPPYVAIMRWEGADNKKEQPVIFVGKGVCFDSGGTCIKPVKEILDMRWDKAGASTVVGLMKAIALAGMKKNITGMVGLVENMPDGNATKPGDVIQTMAGITVEIADTDAEGRLVLADCLSYANRTMNPKVMIDLGTLTLETVSALGEAYAGLYTPSPELALSLKEAGQQAGEEVWQLPLGPFFARQIESHVADIKNVGIANCGENGAAAEFLKRFVGNTPWAHLDIAGVSWTKEETPFFPKPGITGYGVRLLFEWLKTYSL